MVEKRVQRRLAAILAADAVGYSRLMGEDEAGTRARFNSHVNELIEPTIADRQGRIVKTLGDGLLVEFASVVDAVQCAVEIQNGMAERNANEPNDRRIDFRIGVNLGDVIVEGDDIHGDGVNVAARLEGLASPGEICISRAARDQIRDKLDCSLEDLGEVGVKNIARPVRAFRLLPDAERARSSVGQSTDKSRRTKILVAAVALGLIVSGFSLVWIKTRQTGVEAASVDKMAFPLPDKPSVAVLPFTNMSDDKDQEYFADGITQDIITDISKVSGIFVVARNSTFSFKNKAMKVHQIAEDLGVRYVLEGSVRRAGNKLRINVQLIDAVKGAHLWADRYDRKVDDIFEVQSEITQRVVKALAVTLKANEHDRLFQKKVTNIEAYDAFLRARAAVDSPTRANIENGEKLFKRTIDLDPNFAGGYAGLSFNYSVKARFRYGSSPKDDAVRSLELARKAIAADKNFAWSHIALAGAYLANGDHDSAADAAQQAIVIQPNGYEENLFMGFYLNFAGQSALAVKHLELANSLSRLDTIRGLDFLGMAYFMDGNYARCTETWLKRHEKFGIPHYPIGHVFLAAAQALLDKMAGAKDTVDRFRRLSPKFRMSKWLWINNFKLQENRTRLYNAAVKAGIPE